MPNGDVGNVTKRANFMIEYEIPRISDVVSEACDHEIKSLSCVGKLFVTSALGIYARSIAIHERIRVYKPVGSVTAAIDVITGAIDYTVCSLLTEPLALPRLWQPFAGLISDLAAHSVTRA